MKSSSETVESSIPLRNLFTSSPLVTNDLVSGNVLLFSFAESQHGCPFRTSEQ